jgi:predicted O-methyltransferase YrrM|tara:strand:+ start:362 stop:982 length:621 start_codon:yes stop_codon:yes gene_type:complete
MIDKIIEECSQSPYINWNDDSLLDLIRNDEVYNVFIFNKDGNHGYFSLLNRVTANLDDDAIIVELGNREGLGILSVYDAMKENQTFYTLDIVNDIRFIGDKIRNDDRVKILNDFDALDADRVKREFKEKSISMIFMDTVHTYEQLKAEYEIWGPYLKDDCIIMVDDIRPSMPGRTKWKWHVETQFTQKYDVTEWAHNDTGFGVYVK